MLEILTFFGESTLLGLAPTCAHAFSVTTTIPSPGFFVQLQKHRKLALAAI
jgi:hypothetical protein